MFRHLVLYFYLVQHYCFIFKVSNVIIIRIKPHLVIQMLLNKNITSLIVLCTLGNVVNSFFYSRVLFQLQIWVL